MSSVWQTGAELTRATLGSAGYDVCAAQATWILPFQRKLVGTGVRLSSALHFLLLPRSGQAFKRGLTLINAPGLIDSDYRGEVKAAMINLSFIPRRIKAGDRIAQLVPFTETPAEFQNVEFLIPGPDSVRGEGGFGSTGA